MSKEAIGVFDSGIGGLTVLKEMMELLPGEDTIYLGDTARVPYGNKSRKTVIRYSLECASFLLKQGIKLLVVACNTASALALEALEEKLAIPVVGVVKPGAKAAVEATRTGTIGVIGTQSTIRSNVYQRAIQALNRKIEVLTRACPLFVPLAEEGWLENEVALLTAQAYLGDLKDEALDTLVLGCTHYPLLKGVIGQVMGPDVTLVDSAQATAREVARVMRERGLLGREDGLGRQKFFLTDVSPSFVELAGSFLSQPLKEIWPVDLSGMPQSLMSEKYL